LKADEITYNTVSIAPPAGVFDLDMINNSVTRQALYRLILPIIFRLTSDAP
jgi:hypothetical protein